MACVYQENEVDTGAMDTAKLLGYSMKESCYVVPSVGGGGGGDKNLVGG